jgi:hypothetical protein
VLIDKLASGEIVENKMKITPHQLKKIIRESSRQPEIHFEWDRAGLEMIMHADGEERLRFSNKKEVRNLISQLDALLAGPMRTSP